MYIIKVENLSFKFTTDTSVKENA